MWTEMARYNTGSPDGGTEELVLEKDEIGNFNIPEGPCSKVPQAETWLDWSFAVVNCCWDSTFRQTSEPQKRN